MKTKYLLMLCTIILFVSTSNAASVVVITGKSDSSATQRFSFSNKNIEKVLGRKLNWKEKIGLYFYKKRVAKTGTFDAQLSKKANRNALESFIFALLGLLIFPLFFIPAFALSRKALKVEKDNPGILTKSHHNLAKSVKGIFIAWIILTVIGIIVAIIALSNLSFNFNFSNWQFY